MFTFADLLIQRKVILFIDNLGAACTLISGSSTQEDVQCILTQWQLFVIQYKIAVWIEWIPSDQNPADEVSRIASYKGTDSDIMLLPPWAYSDKTYANNIESFLAL